MKVLMFGWEFPPIKSGGLGTACYDLTKGLSKNGVKVSFVMPKCSGENAEYVDLIETDRLMKNVKITEINSILTSYANNITYETTYKENVSHVVGTKGDSIYGQNLMEEVMRYSKVAKHIALTESHDVIHAHDWMAYEAGLNAKKVSGKPLICHIHATESDRTCGYPNPEISNKESEGLNQADLIIANSEYTKQNVIKEYNISSNRINVVHWGIDDTNPVYEESYNSKLTDNNKLVLFLGRVTAQKGPNYFLDAAKKVAEFMPDTKFMVAGSGDMLPKMIENSAKLGLTKNMMFSGFLKGNEVHKAFKMADLYVMPSVSEPFGIVALESIRNGTPTIISKTSGASEVITNSLKVDFWDTDEMANKIVNVLKSPSLYSTLKENTIQESKKFNLDTPAIKTISVYNQVIGGNY